MQSEILFFNDLYREIIFSEMYERSIMYERKHSVISQFNSSALQQRSKGSQGFYFSVTFLKIRCEGSAFLSLIV